MYKIAINNIISKLVCYKLYENMIIACLLLTDNNSVALVRERTIPTERPPLVSEVSANVCGHRVSRGQRDGCLQPCSRFSRLCLSTTSIKKM
jgi:hypothetical protein